jgi:polar amino acid transport system substrate-binding protein
VRIAYLEEPPFYWTADDRSATGADIELADVVLRAIGVSSIEHHPTSFEELLHGVQENRWDMNVPIFITAERAQRVAFSVPVWSLNDGLLVRRTNPKGLTSYKSVAERHDAQLGVVAGTIQFDAAKSAGMNDKRIVTFKDQAQAIAALLAGQIDAYASTALGNRALAAANSELEVVSLEPGSEGQAAFGGFSFNKGNHDLLQAVNQQLRQYLGSPDHRARMAKYGFAATELDSVATA